MNKTTKYGLGVLGAIILIGVVFAVMQNAGQPGQYDEFAQCLVDSGAKMYGAWWCPHCSDQKKAFGRSWKVFEEAGGYVECSTPQKTQIQLCNEEGIDGYPTWRFADGSEMGGNVQLSTLAQKSNCPLQ